MASTKQSNNGRQAALIPAPAAESKSSRNASRLATGLLVTFEGGEGVGKTTQSTRLADRLTALGLDVEFAREPGNTRLGEEIRTWVKRESGTSVTADTLLFAAARAQLVHELIAPRLEQGAVVVVDRFSDSTIAYQGYGRGMDVEQIRTINRIATGGLVPDLTVFLDSDPKTALSRLASGSNGSGEKGRVDSEEERRYEREPISFHEKVRRGFRELAREGGRWSVIKADQAQHRVADAIWKRVRPLLIERGVDPEPLYRKQGAASE